ncbi:MAG: dockerin type I repeat-containing protein [candidate division Zixibacteria bacterium]|nr:dockerin type I repeat-containing protein [candidate division Zixibacteria bacterium]
MLKSRKTLIAVLYFVLICSSVLFAAQLQLTTPRITEELEEAANTRIEDYTSYIDANRIFMFVTNEGMFGRDLAGVFGNDYGTYYPYTSTSDIINGFNTSSPLYAAGIWIGGKVNGQTRVAVAEYSTEYVPGPMQNGTYQPDQYDFKNYKLYNDSMESNPNSDYLNWPVDQGAPVDESGRPVIKGNQMLWSVYNDANPWQHMSNPGNTDPLGIEIQQSVYAYNMGGFDSTIIPSALEVTHLGSSDIGLSAYGATTDVLEGHEYMLIVKKFGPASHEWSLSNLTSGTILLDNQTHSNFGPIEGLRINLDFGTSAIWEYESATPANISPVAMQDYPSYTGGRWFSGTDFGGELFFGGVFMEPSFWGVTSVAPNDIKPVEIRFQPMASYTDLTGDGQYTIGEPFTVDDPGQTQGAFMYYTFDGNAYEGFYPIPFTAWDISDPGNHRQLNVIIRDRDQNHAWNLYSDEYNASLPNDGDLRYNYTWIQDSDYDPTGTYYGDGSGGSIDFWSYNGGNGIWDGMWVLYLRDRYNGGMLAEEGTFRLLPNTGMSVDTFLFTAIAPEVIFSGPEDQAIYLEYKLFNKGSNTISDMYISMWADPDLGGLADDLVGCDTINDVYFCYNHDSYDDQYFDNPPALGFKVLRGPLVPSPGDTAYFDNIPVPNYKNIGMSSFNLYVNGTDPDNAAETYNYMQGLQRNGAPLPNGTKYMVPGNPVAGTGDLDAAPADKRMMASFGPFNFNPGDNQYVLVKMAVGRGADRLESITRAIQVLNNDPGGFPDDPYQMLCSLYPDPQYALFQYAIDPILDTIILGRLGEDIEDINLASIRINNDLVPISTEYLTEYEGFGGRVLRIIFNGSEFVAGYGVVWDMQSKPYTVSGQFSDSSPLFYEGIFLLRGHTSGDANSDGIINAADAVYLINYIFKSGPAPDPIELGDANNDSRINVGDAVFLINYIFRNGPAPGQRQ